MKAKGGFLRGLLSFFLVIIIFGGIGFLGYNIIFKGNAGMGGMGMNSDTTAATESNQDTASAGVSNDSANDSMNMNSDSSGSTSTANAENVYKVNQINQLVKNKDVLEEALNTLNSSINEMTLDPYAAKNNDTAGSQDITGNANASGTKSGDATQSNATPDNTTINIYNGQVDQQTDSQVSMQNMGQTYDADKMQKLHTGLYKVSVGLKLLSQLKENMDAQIEEASIDQTSQTQYYLKQYNIAIGNKEKLTEAFTYLNEAVDLININPYVDENGAVYDKESMTRLHDALYNFAQGVVDLEQLKGDLFDQAIELGTLAQSAAGSLQTDNSMNMTMNTNGIFSNLNTSNIITIVLVGFVVIFIIALLGSILNLFKPNKTNMGKADNNI